MRDNLEILIQLVADKTELLQCGWVKENLCKTLTLTTGRKGMTMTKDPRCGNLELWRTLSRFLSVPAVKLTGGYSTV